MGRSDLKNDLRALGPNLGEGRGRAGRRRRKEIEKEEERKRKGREGSRDLRRRGLFPHPFPPGYPQARLPVSKKDHIDMEWKDNGNEETVFFSRFPPNPKN